MCLFVIMLVLHSTLFFQRNVTYIKTCSDEKHFLTSLHMV